ncbi:MAG TPA: Na+/H+ antiporter NhaA [Sphingomonas sp.]|nr:Na+/H+ antiporter NhaA [Sphingomonas sp.]
MRPLRWKARSPVTALKAFFGNDVSDGLLLMGAAALALIIANSRFAAAYFSGLQAHIGPLSVLHWINDGLMALFFLLAGLEIKREFLSGELSAWADRRLPFIAAGAGMLTPALVYLALARHSPDLLHGWAIPAATDIAFASGVLALLGRRAPASLKIFLITVAVIDDLGAILIIALAYSEEIRIVALLAAALIFVGMIGLNRAGVRRLPVYLIPAAGLWIAVLLSGIHATVAGVLAALVIPLRSGEDPDRPSPLHRLEHMVRDPVAYGVLPLFGFANAGVALDRMGAGDLVAPLPIAIALSLFLGKQLGIFASVRIAVALGIAARPQGTSWRQIYGVALLCGVGFTMSLFIGGLAFVDPRHLSEVKIGVLGGSAISALAGYLLLRFLSGPISSESEATQAKA